jgi:hypothetical protein
MILVCFAFAKAFSQQIDTADIKIEKEERIDASDFPDVSEDVLPVLLRDARRIKYYREQDARAASYEAKFKKKGRDYSVEYSRDGELQDVEIEISRGKIDRVLREELDRQLGTMARKHRVEKVQQQYLPTDEPTQILENIKSKQYDFLELIVALKIEGSISRKELLVDRNGQIVKQRKIKRRSYDFLLF